MPGACNNLIHLAVLGVHYSDLSCLGFRLFVEHTNATVAAACLSLSIHVACSESLCNYCNSHFLHFGGRFQFESRLIDSPQLSFSACSAKELLGIRGLGCFMR